MDRCVCGHPEHSPTGACRASGCRCGQFEPIPEIDKEVVDRTALTYLIADTDVRPRDAGQDEGGRASPTRSGATSTRSPREAPVDA